MRCTGAAGGLRPLSPSVGAVHPAAVITFHTFPGAFGLESLSPFCMKVEVYLKLTKLPYKAVHADPRKAPKGKLPVIVDDDGTKVADSSAILAYLEKKHGEPLDKGVSDLERARAHLLQRTFEESLYFVALWSRWAEDAGWNVVKPIFFGGMPAPLRLIVPPIARKQVVGSAHAQGVGRHSRDEIYAFGIEDLRAISTMLGDQPYFLGEQPRTIDCTAYGFLANGLRFDVDTPLRAHIKGDPRLRAYVERMQQRVVDGGAGEVVAAQ